MFLGLLDLSLSSKLNICVYFYILISMLTIVSLLLYPNKNVDLWD